MRKARRTDTTGHKREVRTAQPMLTAQGHRKLAMVTNRPPRCCWCDELAVTKLGDDEDHLFDPACAKHAAEWGHTYAYDAAEVIS